MRIVYYAVVGTGSQGHMFTAELFCHFTVKRIKLKQVAVEAGNNTDGGMNGNSMRMMEAKKNS